MKCCAHKGHIVNVALASYQARVFNACHQPTYPLSRKAVGSIACWKRHKSVNYHTATECLDEMIDMRMKTILFERQPKMLVGKPRPKIVITVGLQYFYFPTSSTRAENRLQISHDKWKRAKIASDNLFAMLLVCLNGDYLSRNAERLWELSLNILYGNRVSVVVRAGESLVHGEGRQSIFLIRLTKNV